jgi:gliding motility-associated-like protein
MEEVPHISCDLGFYNMITPNGDTSNETWIIENIEEPFYEGNEVAIYNRYGQLVWQIENYNNLDRVFEGKGMDHQLLPDGTYFFEVTYVSGQKTGFLEVQR